MLTRGRESDRMINKEDRGAFCHQYSGVKSGARCCRQNGADAEGEFLHRFFPGKQNKICLTVAQAEDYRKNKDTHHV